MKNGLLFSLLPHHFTNCTKTSLPERDEVFVLLPEEMVPPMRLRPNRGDQSNFLSSSKTSYPNGKRFFSFQQKELVHPKEFFWVQIICQFGTSNFLPEWEEVFVLLQEELAPSMKLSRAGGRADLKVSAAFIPQQHENAERPRP